MSAFARIEYSVFRPEHVSKMIERRWAWKAARCELWHRGISDTFRVEHKGRRAYLKVYRHGWRSRAEIQGEVRLLEFLRRRHVRVAHPISTINGTYIAPVDAPEGLRHAVLFSEAPGVMPKFNGENSRKYGVLAGTIHHATDLLEGVIRRPLLDINHIVYEPLARIHPYLARRPRDLAYLNRISKDLAEAVTGLLSASAGEFGICHGDLTFANLRRDRRGLLTLFDFDCSGYGWRAYDVAVFLLTRGSEFTRRANASRMKQWNAFMDGYHTVRPLSSRELDAINLFVPLRQIWQLGAHPNQLSHVGSRSTQEARFETHLQFIRNWLKIHRPL